MEKKVKKFQKLKCFLFGKIKGSKSCFVLCQLLTFFGVKNLTCSCESSWNEDAKIGIGFVCSSTASRENEQNTFPK